jgi:phosphoenolpyruvate-protein kinase (PTS system EI component)
MAPLGHRDQMRHIRAKSIYPGRIRGLLMEYRRERFTPVAATTENPRSEYRHFRSALRSAQLQLSDEKKMMLDRRKKNPGEILAIDDAINVLESHIMTLEDPYFLGEIKSRIFKTGATGAAALGAVITMVSRQFSFESASEKHGVPGQNRHFLKDMNDMKRRILYFLGLQQELKLPAGIEIVAAQKLTVSEVLALKRAGVKGIIIGPTSETAHELVMLRAMRIPCASVEDSRFFRIKKPVLTLLDADIGYIVLNPRRSARFIPSTVDGDSGRWSMVAKMRSGERFELAGTLHFSGEIEANPPAAGPQQSIGLYRTEYQVSEARELPSTRTLQKQYEQLLEFAPGMDVTFRLFDFTDDKNFLGSPLIENDRDLRGIRYLIRDKKLLDHQLQALIRAAQEKKRPLKILVPYLSEFHELQTVRQHIQAQLSVKRPIKLLLGGMLENTNAIFAARRWIKHVDFFYVGTSDLLSSIAATRRENTDALHRALLSDAFVAMCRELQALSKSCPVTLCGGVVGEPWAIAWLSSFGFRRFVVPTHRMSIIANMIQALRKTDALAFSKKIRQVADEHERLTLAKELALDILYGKS